MNKFASLFTLLAIAVFPGCAGYHVGVDKPAKLAKVTKLAVPTFKNSTLMPRIDVLITNAVIKHLQIEGTYKIVERDEADAVLKAEIIDVNTGQFRSNLENTLETSEIILRIRVNFSVEDKDGVKLFAGQQQGAANQVLDSNFQLTEATILPVAAERLGAQLASQLTAGW